jgi:choice-of-anchor A domain-containing protein
VSQPSFASTFTAPLTTLSDELAAIPGAAPVYNSSSQSYVYDAAAQLVDGVEMTVYDLNTTGVSLSAYLRNFNLGSTGTVVFNVIGPVTDYAFLNAFSDDSQVIWNFNTQTAVDLGTWYGAVLAPDATVTFSGDENGSVVADNLITNSEVHDIAFTGETPSLTLTTGPTTTDSTTPAPEPASLAVLGAGIAGLAFARRSRFRLRAKLS